MNILNHRNVFCLRAARSLALACGFLLAAPLLRAQTQPLVAIHDSELTRALETTPAVAPTPTSPGTSGFQWWITDWHYFVMPESVKEALRSDGTAFTTVGDADVSAGSLLANGKPKYPIVISLAAEAIRDDEIAQFTNYVAAGGFLFVGSSSFTRTTNGLTRGDFALANAMGVHMVNSNLVNWGIDNLLTKQSNHRLVADLPGGDLTWRMPSSSEEISWGLSPSHPFLAPHDVWQVTASDATVLAWGDNNPYILIKPYGKGYFIYDAALQPLIGHGGFAPGMYAYVIFRRAIEWAFESSKLPVTKLSPWPYQYDSAFLVRHDLEDFQSEIADIEASAQVEKSLGAKGDYYFCTGTLRLDMGPAGYNTNSVIASLQRAVSQDGASIGPHNGGLKNPSNPNLAETDYDFWHWGPDEALDVTPPGFSSGKSYAQSSVSSSFSDVEKWLAGLESSSMRLWVAPYFNATRENSYDLQAQLGVKIAGDQKLTPFPHWTLSTQTSGKRYPVLSEPVSDWFVGGLVAQSLEPWHPPGVQTSQTMHAGVDFYYSLGALVNFYSHTLSTGEGDAGQLVPDYINYCLNTNAHPRMWAANAIGVYNWWLARSNAQITVSYSTNGGLSTAAIAIKGATDPSTAVELYLPPGTIGNLQVKLNGAVASTNSYRLQGQNLKVLTGTTVTNAQVTYTLVPLAANDFYTATQNTPLNVPAPGVLANDSAGAGPALTAVLSSAPSHGTLALNADGSFTYTPSNGFTGIDTFTYAANDGVATSATAAVAIMVNPSGVLFTDDFTSSIDPAPIWPWTNQEGTWAITGGKLAGQSGANSYGNAYYNDSTWADYTVQAQVQFSANNGLGGGLGGRLNPLSGAHYAAWIYPENSAGGSAVMKLVKFEGWMSWSGNPMQTVSLPGVGTNAHTVALSFQGANITASYDGVQVISVTDNNFDSVAPYTNGGISADMYTDANAYTLTFDNVSVSGTASQPPPPSPIVASNDNYSTTAGAILAIPAPGVLANDSGGSGPLSALLITGASHGALTFNANGSFSYTPASGFSGTDSFTYEATTGGSNSAPATVSISVAPTGVLFSDDFSRSTDPGPLTPWVANSGTWTVTGGRLAGSSAPNAYGNAYYDSPGWTDYTVQAQIQFSSTSGYGGGIGGRLNPATGAHYAAWVYPENSAGGASVLKLVKFEGWTTWSFTPMQTVSLPGVGTNWHTVAMTFHGPAINISYDGAQVASVTDNNFDSVAPFTSGGITADMYSDANGYTLSVDNVTVTGATTGTPPSITAQPTNATVNAGATATFTVTAGGAAPLAYQWLKNGAVLPNGGTVSGADTATLTLSSVTSSNAASYSVVVTNAAGSVTSSAASLTVIVPPVITAQPQSSTNPAGTTASFSVAASGTGLSYQWQFNSTNITGATGSNYSIANVQAANAGNYTVVVRNTAGSVTSSVAKLTVILPTPPSITAQPQPLTVNAGQSASFSVSATGTAPLRYQWQFNSASLSGATNASYNIASAKTNNAGDYRVIVSNAAGSVTSSVAHLTVIAPTPPSITSQPQSQTVIAGTNVTFAVTATGTAPLQYQWKFKGKNISGATNSSYTLANAQNANAGSYTVTVSNAAGSVTSSAATLTVNYSLTITTINGGTVMVLPALASYPPGTVVTLAAMPAIGHPFVNWSGSVTSSKNPVSITMNANKAVTANFKP